MLHILGPFTVLVGSIFEFSAKISRWLLFQLSWKICKAFFGEVTLACANPLFMDC